MEDITNNIDSSRNQKSFIKRFILTFVFLGLLNAVDSFLARVLEKGTLYYLLALPGIFFSIWGIYRYIWKAYFFNLKAKKRPCLGKESIRPVEKEDRAININGTISIPNPYTGVLIVGGAGSGKSKSLIEPIIYEASRIDYSGIVYDFKFPTLAVHVAGAYRNNLKIKQFYVNFSDLNYSHTVNPVSPNIMINSSFAREFASTILANINPQSISKPDFWSDNAQTFLSAVLWFLREERSEYCTLPHAMAMILGSDTERLINLLKSNPQSKDMIQPIATAYEAGSSNQIAGVVSSLQVSLSKINIPEIYWVLGDCEVDCNLDLNDPQSPAILTIGNDPVLSSTYGPAIGLIIAATAKLLNRQGKHQSMLLIDEFPTVYIPGIEQLPATARSNKVATILACQDITQIIDKYGKQKSDTVLSNLGNQFYGRSSNPDTTLRVSKIFGKTDKLMESKSANYAAGLFNQKKGTSKSFSYQERDIVKPQDVATLDTGSFYVSLSEGTEKQKKIVVSIDDSKDAVESLKKIDNILPDQVKSKYLKIRMEGEAIVNGLL